MLVRLLLRIFKKVSWYRCSTDQKERGPLVPRTSSQQRREYITRHNHVFVISLLKFTWNGWM